MAWNIDPAHSQISFSVRHMMISNVRGRFENFTGTVEFDENNLATLKAVVEVDAASISTRDEKRDGHLRSADFLDVENSPTVTFHSTGARVTGAGTLDVDGDLTIRDVTRPVTLKVAYAGAMLSPWGTRSAGFSAHVTINRKDWGLVWNQGLEAGGLLVGEDVKLEFELELIEELVEEVATA